MELLSGVLEYVIPALAACGVAVMVWGVATALVRFVKLELCLLSGKTCDWRKEDIRQHLGYHLLLGLEFLIAVDVIESVQEPTWEQLGILGGIVLVRTIISVSLHWELNADEESKRISPSATR